MPWYYLLIIIVQGQATVVETNSAEACLSAKQYIVEHALKGADKSQYALECFPKMGGESKKTGGEE